MVEQGEIYWLDMGEAEGSTPAYRHPYLVIQNDALNLSKLQTTVVLELSSNLKYSNFPGNVQLKLGEANLNKASVVKVTQIFCVNKSDLEEKIGKLSHQRITELIKSVSSVFALQDISPL